MKGVIRFYLKPEVEVENIVNCFDCIVTQWSIIDYESGYINCFYDGDFEWESHESSDVNKIVNNFRKSICHEPVCGIVIMTKLPSDNGEMMYAGGSLLFESRSEIHFIIDMYTKYLNEEKDIDWEFYLGKLSTCLMSITEEYEFAYM